ncbi:hypothetical protein [Robiginitomaculum antarcticum]|uniref:hypothetical protein n=1 Tax=Robiginitomaculum antarcticum TaxID=437507 RepID=UPI000375EF6C|nr:hypothetical protein [Robiginitomaculum antarcticum]
MNPFVLSNEFGTGNVYLGSITEASPLQTKLLFTVVFIPAEQSDPPNQYTLEAAWGSKDGRLFILGEMLSDAKTFLADVDRMEFDLSEGLVWILNPNSKRSNWIYSAFKLSALVDAKRQLLNDVTLNLSDERAGYILKLAKKSDIALDAVLNILRISHVTASPQFGRGTTLLPVKSPGLSCDISNVTGVSFDFEFDIPGKEDLAVWLNNLDVGLRYSVVNDGTIKSIRYPVFSSHKLLDGVTASAKIVPLNFLEPAASYITLSRDSDKTDIFLTNFRTVTGRAATFALGGQSIKLYFAQATSDTYTLVPSGKFKFKITEQLRDSEEVNPLLVSDPEDYELACGASGTEYFRIPKLARDILFIDFMPGCPGHSVAVDADTFGLDRTTVTSWVRFGFGQTADVTALEYYAQPEGQATLFMASQPAGSAKVPLLPYQPMIAAHIGPGDSAPILPWVPLAGVDIAARDAAIGLESTAIAPTRKSIFSDAEYSKFLDGHLHSGLPSNTAFEVDGSYTAITPRGLEASFTTTGSAETWDAVHLARLFDTDSGTNINSGRIVLGQYPPVVPPPPPEQSKNKKINSEDVEPLQKIVEPLKSALLTNQQFIVITDGSKIQPFFQGDNAKVKLKGWEFLLSPEHWDSHGTIMIVKSAITSLRDLAFDSGAWTSGGVFNRNVTIAAKALQTIIIESEQEYDNLAEKQLSAVGPAQGSPSDLEYFVQNVLRSPDWNGTLFLNANLGSFPDDLAGLRAGIQPGGLFAHHLGITQTPFENLKELQSNSSDMFGLIRYADTRTEFGQSNTYDFRVQDLGVLFRNSQVRDFRARINIHLANLFGQYARDEDGGPAIADLIGIRHRRANADAYMFTAEKENTFKLGGEILTHVEIIHGEFETVSVDPSATGTTSTRFLFAGQAKFSNIDNFDIFSFDNLAFSNLALNMRFQNDKPLHPEFEFSTETTVLDGPLSDVRGGSLYEGFPAQLSHFIDSKGIKPTAMGYMTVQNNLVLADLPKDWFGLAIKLDMGSLSDTAGAAGLEAFMILAWGTQKNQIFVGLEIKGYGLSGSSDELSLLGVLKLKMYSLSLRKGNREGDKGWALMMHGMTLKIFSKSLPPSGSFDFYLFGNPDPDGSANNFGWYGAYVQDVEDKESAKAVTDSRRPRLPQAEYTFPNLISKDDPLPVTIRGRGRRT